MLEGGQGNDVYVVDGSDVVLETQGGLIGGIDRIMTSGDWVLSTPNVEGLRRPVRIMYGLLVTS